MHIFLTTGAKKVIRGWDLDIIGNHLQVHHLICISVKKIEYGRLAVAGHVERSSQSPYGV